MAARALSILSTSTFHSPCLPKKPTTISSSSSLSQNSFVSCLSPLSGSLFGESIYQSLRPLIPSPKQGLFHSAMVLSMLPTAKHDIAPDKIPKWSARSIKSFGMGELEARKLKYPNTGTEALLMGILVEGTSRAARFLRENGITLFKVREETVKLLGKSDMYFFSPEHPPLTEPAQRALDWAVDEKTKSEMRMLGWMSGFTLRDRIRNEHIREKVGVAPVEDKIRGSCLRWFDHIKQWPSNDPVRKVEVLDLT